MSIVKNQLFQDERKFHHIFRYKEVGTNREQYQDYVRELRLCGDEVIEMTEEILNSVTADERIRQAALARERWEWDRRVDEVLKKKAMDERDEAVHKLNVAEHQLDMAEQQLDIAKRQLDVFKGELDAIVASAEKKLKEKGLNEQEIADIINVSADVKEKVKG